MNFFRHYKHFIIVLLAVLVLAVPASQIALAQDPAPSDTSTLESDFDAALGTEAPTTPPSGSFSLGDIGTAAFRFSPLGIAYTGVEQAVSAVGGSVATVASDALEQVLFSFVINVFGLFVWLGGSILDAGIDYFVLGFGDTFLNSGMGVAVNNAWIIIRDFVNLFFIFGLVYIGFKMILDIDSSNTRRMLVNLILAALLVNFSLFITKFVVDISNQLSSEIAVAGLGAKIDPETGRYASDISGKFFHRMGMSAILQAKPAGAGYGYIMGTAVLLLVTAFVFAAGGILLIIRFAVLCIFILFSPVMFLGWIISPVGDTMKRYWKEFIKRCFFAPIYLLFLYFSLQLIGGLQQSIGNTGNTDLAHPNWPLTRDAAQLATTEVSGSGLGTLPFFVLICVFMIASLVISRKLGAEGANTAVAMGKRWGTKTAKWTGAQTGGRLARAASEKTGYLVERDLRRAQQLQGDGWMARKTRALARSNAVQGTVGGAATALQKTKFGLSRTIEEDRKMSRQTDKWSDNAMSVRDGLVAQKEQDTIPEGMASVVRNGIKTLVPINQLSPQEKVIHDRETKAREDRTAKMQRIVADMSIKDFEAMTENEQKSVARFISGTLSENIQKSDNISDTQKSELTDLQKEALRDKISEGVGATRELLTEKLADLTIREIEILGDEFVTENAAFFTDSQFSDIKKSKKFTEGQVGRYIGKRKSDMVKRVDDPASADFDPDSVFKLKGVKIDPNTGVRSVDYHKPKKVAEIAKLPGEALEKPSSAKYITVDVLKAIGSGDKEFERVSTTQREAIEANLAKVDRDSQATPEQKQNAKKALAYLKTSKGQENFLGQDVPSVPAKTVPPPTA